MTVPQGPARPSRRSIAARMRGWSAEADVAEQRLKDQVTLRLSVRRRWWMIGVGAGVMALGRAVGALTVSPLTVAAVVAVAALINLVIAGALRCTPWP
jgi:hypothetical protein